MGQIALVEIENLTYAYPARVGAREAAGQAALVDVDLVVREGEFVLVAGPSGCGKSTLLRAIASLVPHFYGGRFSGAARIAGRDTRTTKPAELAGTVGFVFQDPEAQVVSTGVEAEIAFGLENLGLGPSEIAKRTEETLVAMGISDLRQGSTGEMSGGQLQKVALAAVLAMQPEVLLLDEPTSQLDPVAAEILLASLRRVNEEIGMTVIIAEHRLERCHHFADRVIIMEGGRVVCDDEPRAAARWATREGNQFVPPIGRIFDVLGNGNVPLTVKEGRTLLASLRGGHEVDRAADREPRTPAPETGGKGPRAAETDPGDARPGLAGPATRCEKTAIDVRGLWHTYPNGMEALRGCDLSVVAGEFIALMGENGAGKSTLVRHFNGLLRPGRGSVALFGEPTAGAPTERLACVCGLLAQNPNDHLFSETVCDELVFTARNLLREDEVAASVEETLDLFDLARLADANPRSLSAGERQRVALAALLVARPRIVVLDEPTRGMDYRHKEQLGQFLVRLQNEGKTIVVVTHDVEFAATFAERVALMGGGRIVACGSKYDVMSDAVFLSPQANRLMRGTVPGVLTVEEARRALEAIAP